MECATILWEIRGKIGKYIKCELIHLRLNLPMHLMVNKGVQSNEEGLMGFEWVGWGMIFLWKLNVYFFSDIWNWLLSDGPHSSNFDIFFCTGQYKKSHKIGPRMVWA